MVFVTEPLKEEDMIRPRLSKLEVQVIASSLTLLMNRLNGTEDKKSLEWIKRLSERFEHIQNGSKFLRPRR